MRQLTILEITEISGGKEAPDLIGMIQSVAQTTTHYIKPELLFGALALALFFSPAGLPMSLSGAAVGAVAGFCYGQLLS